MITLLNIEKLILQAYLKLPERPLLNHDYELEEDALAGIVSRFLKGERFKEPFIAFSDDQSKRIESLIQKNIENEDGKDLMTAFLVTKAVCNILNKYQKK